MKQKKVIKGLTIGALVPAIIYGVSKLYKKKRFDPVSYEKLSTMNIQELTDYKTNLQTKLNNCTPKTGGNSIFFEESPEEKQKRELVREIMFLQDKLSRCTYLKKY